MSQIDTPDNPADYVMLGDVVRHFCSMQCQYGSRYAGGLPTTGEPDLTGPEHGDGRDLRYTPAGPGGNYHEMTIHKDDAVEFARRILSHRYARQRPYMSDERWAEIIAPLDTPLPARH